MIFKIAAKAAILGLFTVILVAPAKQATAESATITTWEKVYKVQVEYWFWDSDYYYWQNYYESTDFGAANFVYQFLKQAEMNGTLNSVAPNVNWKYFAVDVRFIYEWEPRYEPRFFEPEQTDSSSIGSRTAATRD